MKQMTAILLLVCACRAVLAESYSSTTDVLYIDYGAAVISGRTANALSYRVTATMGGSPFDLTGMTVYWRWYSGSSVIASYPAAVEDPTGGIAYASVTPANSFTGDGRMEAYSELSGALVGTLALDHISVTATGSGGTGCGDVTVNVTNTIVNDFSTNSWTIYNTTNIVTTNLFTGMTNLFFSTINTNAGSTNWFVYFTYGTNSVGWVLPSWLSPLPGLLSQDFYFGAISTNDSSTNVFAYFWFGTNQVGWVLPWSQP